MRHYFYHLYKLINILLVKIRRDIIEKGYRTIALILLSFFSFYYFNFFGAVLWILFFIFYFYDWDNRIIGIFGILSLISCPFLIQFDYVEYGEIMAVNSWFFMVIFVVLQIFYFIRHPNEIEEF